MRRPTVDELLDAVVDVVRFFHVLFAWVDELAERVRLWLWYQVGEVAMIYSARQLQWFAMARMGCDPACFPPWYPAWKIDLWHRSWGARAPIDSRLLPTDEQPATPVVLPARPRNYLTRPIWHGPPPEPRNPGPFHAADLLEPSPRWVLGLSGWMISIHCGDHRHEVHRASRGRHDRALYCRELRRWYVVSFSETFGAAVDFLPPEQLQARRAPGLGPARAPGGLEAR